MTHHASTAAVFERLLALLEEREPDPFGYYQTHGRLVAEQQTDGAVTFRLVLTHEPISEEAAVEEDRDEWTLRPDTDADALVEAASAFLDEHWR